jgi:hypothetical protein
MKSIASIATALVFAALLAPSFADAKDPGSRSHSSKHSGGHPKAKGVARDSHGRIARSSSAKHDFQKSHPCPKTGKSSGACPGYVIDHVKPLERGGADSPSNMQWQTKKQAKIKDKTE